MLAQVMSLAAGGRLIPTGQFLNLNSQPTQKQILSIDPGFSYSDVFDFNDGNAYTTFSQNTSGR